MCDTKLLTQLNAGLGVFQEAIPAPIPGGRMNSVMRLNEREHIGVNAGPRRDA